MSLTRTTPKARPIAGSIRLRMIYHREPVRLIQSLRAGRKITLLNSKHPLHKNPATLKLTKNNLSIRIIATKTHPFRVDVGQQNKSFYANVRPRPFTLKGMFLSLQQSKLSKGTVHEIHSKGYQINLPYFYRVILPLEKELTLHYSLEEQVFATDFGYKCRTGSAVRSEDENFTLCIFHDDQDQYYLSIESNKRQSLESFSDKCFAIQCGLAFLTGKFSNGTNFYFAYRKANMKKYSQFRMMEGRKSINSLYQPIYTNPYAFSGISRPMRQVWYEANVLRPISITEFSQLYEKLLRSTDLRAAVLLLVQSLAASMEQMPGGVSVVLEMLPAIILGKNTGSHKPIKSPSLHTNILDAFTKILDEHRDELGADGHAIIFNRLQNINQPTNFSKLKAPFERLGIPLMPEDLVVLDSRNKFLHGEVPDILKKGKDRPNERKTRDTYYCGIRLYTLISMLLLKWVGYDNYVLNQPIIHNNVCEIPLNEAMYRKDTSASDLLLARPKRRKKIKYPPIILHPSKRS